MAIFTWNSNLSVSINEIDTQHKKLIDLINALHDALKAGKAKDVMAATLKELLNYTVYHFSNEEKYMNQFNYSGKVEHFAEHKKFIDKVTALQKDFQAGKLMITLDAMNFLQDWVAKHIMGIDKKYVSCFQEHGVK